MNRSGLHAVEEEEIAFLKGFASSFCCEEGASDVNSEVFEGCERSRGYSRPWERRIGLSFAFCLMDPPAFDTLSHEPLRHGGGSCEPVFLLYN